MDYDKVNIKEIIESSIKLFLIKTKEKKIKLITQIDKKIPRNFYTDSKRL